MPDSTQALATQEHAGDGAPQKPTSLPTGAANLQLQSLDDVMRLGEVLAQSGFFDDARDAGRAVTKILAGAERGISPIASMTGIHVIKGKITMGADLIATQLKRHPQYDYRVAHLSDEKCVIGFYESGEKIGESAFDEDDAEAAGVNNMNKFPRNMLFARAMTNGVKWYCPDAVDGDVYTPEEMGAGDHPTDTEEAAYEDVRPPSKGDQSRKLYDQSDREDKDADPATITSEEAQQLVIKVKDLVGEAASDTWRYGFASYIVGGDVASFTALTEGERDLIENVVEGVAALVEEEAPWSSPASTQAFLDYAGAEGLPYHQGADEARAALEAYVEHMEAEMAGGDDE
jgi:hypothetical protein